MTQRERQILQWIRENPMISQQELADKAGIARSSVAVHISNLMKKGCIAGKGYILSTEPYVVVIGGVNMDIGGRAVSPLVARDSNPGTVRMTPGGVGRNIAHNLRLLDVDTKLLTAFGDDVSAQKLTVGCGELGIDVSQSLVVPGAATSTYLFISGPDGDMELAMSDMEIYDLLTPEFLSSRSSLLSGAAAVVVDANIPEASICWLAGNVKAPIFADPVSTAKAPKLLSSLGKLHAIKPNRMEAELLSGIAIRDEDSLYRAADRLLDTGLSQVYISLGGDGILAADRERRVHIPCIPGVMENTTGCGDAGTAALVWAFLEERDLTGSAAAAMAAGSIAMESDGAINPALTVSALQDRMQRASFDNI